MLRDIIMDLPIPIQAGLFWNHIGWGGGHIVPPSVSPLFVIQLPLNLAC